MFVNPKKTKRKKNTVLGHNGGSSTCCTSAGQIIYIDELIRLVGPKTRIIYWAGSLIFSHLVLAALGDNIARATYSQVSSGTEDSIDQSKGRQSLCGGVRLQARHGAEARWFAMSCGETCSDTA
jgi:hypothetical protein